MMQSRPDADLWNACRQGDQSAWGELFDRYFKLLHRYGIRMGVDADSVDDCIQELFLELWTGRSLVIEVRSVKAYLFKSLRFKLYRHLQKASRYSNQSTEANENLVHEQLIESSFQDALINHQDGLALQRKLDESLQKLSARQREAIYLKFYGGLDYEELCDTLAINYQAARSLVYQAIKLLRKNMLLGSLLLLLRQS